MPRARSGPSAAIPATAAVSSVSVMPNFEVPRPTARPACVSGVTSGFRRSRTSSARPGAVAEAGAPGDGQQGGDLLGLSTATHRSGSPSLAARTAARRSAAVLPMPSSVIRSLPMPARRAAAHSPDETTFAAEPRGAEPRDDRRDVVGLDRVGAQPRVGEGVAELRRGVVEGGGRRDVDRSAEASGRGAERVGGHGPRAQSWTTSPMTVVMRPIAIDATIAAMMASIESALSGKPAIVNGMSNQVLAT